MESREWVYINNNDNSSRYVLGTIGKRTLFCFGINPSTAEPNSLDKTLMNVEAISKHNGYDSWIMFNIYPKRDTHFESLSSIINDDEHIKNVEIIRNTLSTQDNIDIWLAFGNHIYHRDYLAKCLVDIYEELKDKNIRWYSIGCNKSGAPKHPLYQRKNSQLISFDIAKYIETLSN